MRVIELRDFAQIQRKRRKKLHYKRYILLIIIIFIGAVGYNRYNRPLPEYQVKLNNNLSSGNKVEFVWPAGAQAAVGIVGKGLVASNNSEEAKPIASVAKIITALVVLDKKPIKLNEAGDNIPITSADRLIYDKYFVQDGSIVPVDESTPLTERQALEALLIPSSNNVAETLTNWAFGSQEEYLKYANSYLKKNNFNKTVVADSSGFSPGTISTATDLVLIGEMAMKNPVIADIVARTQTDIPFAGTIRNTNWLLGKEGVNGIKTGNTNEAGGCFLVSVSLNLPDGSNSTIIGAIVGAKDLDKAMEDVQPLVLKQIQKGFNDHIVISQGQQLGVIKTMWGEQSAIVADKDISLYGWQEDKPEIKIDIDQNTKYAKGSTIGNVNVSLGKNSGSVKILQYSEIQEPDFWWKFKRIFNN